MQLEDLQRHWDRFGRDDPFWAILTDADKRDGGWSPDEFFAHGVREIEYVVLHARELGVAVGGARALDFGCGAGRVTQALCSRFDECDGVDIALSMVELARRLNRHGSRCRYHQNSAPDLRLFHDATFDFVYSVLVLQHMPPPLVGGYLGEFLRVLKPGGLLVFQLPSEPAVSARPEAAAVPCDGAPLPPTAFKARLVGEGVPPSVEAGETFEVKVVLQNRGDSTWPAVAHPERRGNVVLGNHWRGTDRTMVAQDDARTPLREDLLPGDDVELVIAPTAPALPGDYLLDFDLVQEGVSWFESYGSLPARFPVRVVPRESETRALAASPEPVASAGPVPGPESGPRPDAGPTGEVGPPRRLGLAAAPAWLRGLFARPLRERPPEPPAPQASPEPAANGDWQPVMEMNCVPRQEVLALLAAAGGRVIDVERHPLPGFRSYRYWVVR